MNRYATNGRKPPAPENTCCGCMACADACPVGAISGRVSGNGFLVPEIDERLCCGCDRCDAICPAAAAGLRNSGGEVAIEVFAAWHRVAEVRRNSASGGVFYALGEYVLSRGGVVCGAAIDGVKTVHRFVESLAELPMLQGSKYQQGDLSRIYAGVCGHLKNGRTVLFSGLPCQVAALQRYIGDMPHSGRLFTVDVICGGVPSAVPLKLYMKTHPDLRKIVGFRDKRAGWKSAGYRYNFSVEDAGGQRRDEGDFNAVTEGFSRELFLRECCLDCRFAAAPRPGDVTIGDFWGISDYPEEHALGISAAIANSAAGKSLLQAAELELYVRSFSEVAAGNPCLVGKKRKFTNRELNRRLQKMIFKLYFRWFGKNSPAVLKTMYRVAMKAASAVKI